MATPTTKEPQPISPRGPLRNNAMLLRLVSRVLVGTLVVIVAAVLITHTRLDNTQKTPASLQGTALGGNPAPGFSLTDQNGAQISLSSLRGHPVVLTFFFTHCTEECPLTASKFQRVLSQWGAQLGDVRWVAVSIDPVGDTPQTATAFVQQHGLSGTLHYLLGTQAQLAPIWSAYSVAVGNGGMMSGTPQSGTIQHTGGVWLIDAQGREQVYLDAAFNPQALASDLRILTGK